MKEHLVYIIKPNNTFPCFGDTHYLTSRQWLNKKYNTEELRYIESRSKYGTQPKNIDIVYPEAGYAIFREDWGSLQTYDKMTYLAQIVSIKSIVHKHSDYQSFVLYSKGEDLIVDPGYGGYQKNDTLTYLKSTLAHNVVTVDNKNYKIKEIKPNDANIYDYKLNET